MSTLLEDEIRATFADRANEVPTSSVERVHSARYRPHAYSTRARRTLGVGGAVACIALAASGLVLTASPSGPDKTHDAWNANGVVVSGGKRLTASYVLTAAKTALANVSDDVIVENESLSNGSSVTISFDEVTGQIRNDSYRNGQPEYTNWSDNDKSVSNQTVVVNWPNKVWWSLPDQDGTQSLTTPQDIANELANGALTLVGSQQLDGQQTIELSSTGDSGLQNVWVNATTYLPVEFSTSNTATPPVTGIATFTFTPEASANTSVFNVSIPAAFQQLPTPPGAQPNVIGKG